MKLTLKKSCDPLEELSNQDDLDQEDDKEDDKDDDQEGDQVVYYSSAKNHVRRRRSIEEVETEEEVTF